MSTTPGSADRHRMRSRLKLFTALAATLVIGGVVVMGWAVAASAAPRAKVAYCHATRSHYVYHQTAADSIVKSGHSSHPDDIIPPFDYDGGHFDGLNWPQGKAILDARCVVSDQGPTTAPQDTTPQDTTPQDTTPQDTTP